MRWSALWVLAVVACGRPPLRQLEFPTLSVAETYDTRILNLRTTLGRGGIGLKVAGFATTFSTTDCDDSDSLTAIVAGCARCVLASEATPIDGAVVEAATRSFARYPAAVLAATDVEYVAVCAEIVQNDGDGAPLERPAGVADLQGKRLLLSVKSFLGEETYRSGGALTVDDIAHHEVFHHLEYARMRADMMNDPEWNLHNPLGFTYAREHRSGPRQPGFVNAYAMTNAIEDKASVYEMIMAHADELCELAKADEVIRIKTKIIWRRVLRAVGTDQFMRDAAPCVTWI